MRIDRSVALFQEAVRLMPGGVNSPARAFGAVGGNPVFISRGQGARLFDVDGNTYVDYLGSGGSLILGHAHSQITLVLHSAAERGISYGAPTQLSIDLARTIAEAMPAVEMLRFVNSSTEATLTALRLARAFTGRHKVLRFAGCYHGHPDELLSSPHTETAAPGVASSPGVLPGLAEHVLTAPYNDLEAVENLVRSHRGQIAAVIVEPVAGNMGVVAPAPGFLDGLRRLTSEVGALLIFDEVITGFRVAYGGAQSRYGVAPDLTLLGRVIGGGLPIGALGGRREILEMLAPVGPVHQASTLAGNPLAMKAGIATLTVLQQPGVYEELDGRASRLGTGVAEAAREAGVPVRVGRVGSMFSFFFTEQEVSDCESAGSSDTDSYATFFHALLEQGVYLPPSPFEAAFLSLAHGDEVVDLTVRAAREALQMVAEKGRK